MLLMADIGPLHGRKGRQPIIIGKSPSASLDFAERSRELFEPSLRRLSSSFEVRILRALAPDFGGLASGFALLHETLPMPLS